MSIVHLLVFRQTPCTEITLPCGWPSYYSKTDVDIFLTQIIEVGRRLDKK